ncbi:MAG: hypothetical protein SXA11_01815 [Cyanobacteriota bacterium]|nr:hypothetical protein [Cyanobacteriota bacterium]
MKIQGVQVFPPITAGAIAFVIRHQMGVTICMAADNDTNLGCMQSLRRGDSSSAMKTDLLKAIPTPAPDRR